jgi:uncharacterized membrane protein YsdA (DUF1294 family)
MRSAERLFRLAAFLLYIAIINGIGLLLIRRDKSQSRKNGWRVAEKHLFLIAALGGSLGVWAGMYRYRHKTKHLSFVLGIPAIAALQAGIAIVILYLSAAHS